MRFRFGLAVVTVFAFTSLTLGDGPRAVGDAAYPKAPTAGPTVVDRELRITLTLPDGFERIDCAGLPGNDIRYAFGRRSGDDNRATVVLIERLRRALGREPLSPADSAAHPDMRVTRAKWKSFDVDVFVTTRTEQGRTFIARIVQVPVAPRAIQLCIIGPPAQDTELAELTQTLLASLDGRSNWLTPEERTERLAEGVTRSLYWIVGISVGIWLLTGWRTSVFRNRLVRFGFSVEQARQKLRPSWVWYLLSAYLLFAAVIVGGLFFLMDWADPQTKPRSSHNSSMILLGGLLVSTVLTVFIMRRRVLAKRRIVASLISQAVDASVDGSAVAPAPAGEEPSNSIPENRIP